MSDCDVSVIGLYILDILGRPVAAIPSGGNVEFIEEIRLTVAGTAGGTAVDCAKLGLRTRAVGAVGDDEKADFVVATLAGHGVDTVGMQRHVGVPTSATILNVRPNGDRPALHQRGASDYFLPSAEEVARAIEPPFVHVGGTGLLRAFDGAPTVNMLRAAKDAGRTTTYDLIAASAQTLALVRPALPYVDWFIPSIEEARAICGLGPARDVAAFFRDLGARNAVLTMGGDGCLVSGEGYVLRLPAFDVTVSDTTGCGDAFSAGLIAALARGWDIESAARFAGAAGALVATGLGSDAGIVDFASTERAMRNLPTRPLAEA